MRIGIIGYGSIGKRHGQNLMALGHKIIIHDPAMAESLPRDKVIEQADAIVIASPTTEHQLSIAACSVAKKPCFVEKPISFQFGSWAKWLKWPLMVGYNMRFHPCVIKAKEWLADDRVGPPLWSSFICAQYNDKPEYLRDGVVLNWSHEIDLALSLLGESEIKAAAVDEADTVADIILRHKSGCQSNIHLDYVTRPEHRGFSIAGPKGVMIANLPQRSILLLDTDGYIRQQEQYPGDYNDDYINEMRAFIGRVENTELQYGCTAREAIEVLKICLKAKKMGQ